MAEIQIEPVDATNWRAVCDLRVAPEQVPFVCTFEPPAAEAIVKAYVKSGGCPAFPYAIRSDSECVGFFLYEDHAEFLWIFHFFIDVRFQGRGFARAAIRRLADHAATKHPAAKWMQLTVHPENDRGRDVYAAAGFKLTEEFHRGHPLWKLDLSPSSQS